MNAVTSTLGKPSKPGAFKWLIKREFWENRGGFFWAPVITGGIFLVLNLILAVIGSIAARRSMDGGGFVIDDAPEKAHQIVGGIGDGMLLVYRHPSRVHFRQATYLSLRVPLGALAMLVDVESAAGRRIRGDTAPLQLLRRYVASLPERLTDPALGGLVATHVHDLMALAIGATGEGREIARGRGVRAARLAAIEADLTLDASLSIDEIARRQGVTTRYVQILFEDAGTTFGEFVTARRLDAARAMLRSPRYAQWSVAGIAFEAGFKDLSHFNRRFRQRFGLTPREFRLHGTAERTPASPLESD